MENEEGACELCEKFAKDKEFGEYRSTIIGWICPGCFPLYKNIHDKIYTHYEKNLKIILSKIEL